MVSHDMYEAKWSGGHFPQSPHWPMGGLTPIGRVVFLFSQFVLQLILGRAVSGVFFTNLIPKECIGVLDFTSLVQHRKIARSDKIVFMPRSVAILAGSNFLTEFTVFFERYQVLQIFFHIAYQKN